MFCQKCGTELPDTSTFCISCGAAVATIPVTSEHPSAFPLFISSVFKYIGGLFKAPAKNVQTIASDKNPVWIVYESVKYIVVFVAVLLLTLAANQGWVGAANICNMINDATLCNNFGVKLIFSMLIFGCTFGTQILTTWLTATQISKLDVSMNTILNICSISGVLMIPFMMAAIVCAFMWYPLALLMLAIGGILCFTMFTESVRASGIFGGDTAWKNMLVLGSTAAVFSLLLMLFLM